MDLLFDANHSLGVLFSKPSKLALFLSVFEHLILDRFEIANGVFKSSDRGSKISFDIFDS